VLYDIENLVGGYNLKYLSEISLKNIINELNNIGLSNIAIQKAYADWSNFKLNELKWDIAELGIEPIQMYGFSKGNMKNAADIQLVIDAMEILHTKPFIDIFVIVSGDGGFSSLVKKISEYGKKVIGCAYQNTANKIFVQICDDFIYIDNTLTKEQLSILEQVQLDENKKKQIIENPILKDTLPSFNILNKYDLDEVEKIVNEFMNSLYTNYSAKKILQKEGLNISVFKSALNYLFLDFESKQFGFARLSDFIRYILKDTDFKLILKEPSDYRILHKDYFLKQFNDIEPLHNKPKIHCMENYINFLSSKKPLIFIPENICNFYKVVEYLIENRLEFRNKFYNDIVSELISLNIEEKEIHKTLSLLINTDILKGDNSSTIMKEQFYYFSPINIEDVLNIIYDKIKEKILLSIDGTINDDELQKIIMKFNKNC
jgi:uncharacterized LabA/DUF88 family protein